MHTHQITLTKEENQVYQKILDFSRKALEQYIKTQEQKLKDDYNRKSELVTNQIRLWKLKYYSLICRIVSSRAIFVWNETMISYSSR